MAKKNGFMYCNFYKLFHTAPLIQTQHFLYLFQIKSPRFSLSRDLVVFLNKAFIVTHLQERVAEKSLFFILNCRVIKVELWEIKADVSQLPWWTVAPSLGRRVLSVISVWFVSLNIRKLYIYKLCKDRCSGCIDLYVITSLSSQSVHITM